MINCLLAKNFVGFQVRKVKAGRPYFSYTHVSFYQNKIISKQNITDKHLGECQLILALMCHWKVLVIMCH